MGVTDPAPPSTRVGATGLSARASEVHANAANTTMAPSAGRHRIRLMSAAPGDTDHHCPRTPTVNMRSEKFECPH
jgi:hypothetical protein